MNQLKRLQTMQVFVSCLICTGVWSNLFVNVQNKQLIKKDENRVNSTKF